MDKKIFKKVKKKLLAAALMAAAVVTAIPDVPVRAAALSIEREISVNYSDVLNQAAVANAYQENPYRDFGASAEIDTLFYYKYRFDLDSLCYINLYANSAAAEDWWEGDYSVYLGISADDFSCPVATKKYADGGSPVNTTVALEKGSYYLIVASRITYDGYTGKKENLAWNKAGSVSVNINAQRLQRTGGVSGATKQDAVFAENGKVTTGFITGMFPDSKAGTSIPSQWFKVRATSAAAMNATVAITRPQGYDDRMGVTAKLYNALGILLQAEKSSENSNAVSFVSPDLPAGDYYIEVSYPGFCEVSVLPDVTVIQEKQQAPARPVSVKATPGKKKVTLKWKKCTGAASYEIYRSTKKASGYKKIGTAKKATYTDKKGLKSKKTYYYKVRAYQSKKNVSKFSAVVKAKVK